MNHSSLRPSRTTPAAAGLALFLACVLTPTTVLAQSTYLWVQGLGFAAWSNAGSWSPSRSTPAATDILVFDGTMIPGGVAEISVDVAAQTFGQFVVTNGAVVKLARNAAGTLTVDGGTGVDFHLQAGTTLEFSGSLGAGVAMTLGAAATGQVDGGAVAISTASNGRLQATTAGALHFLSGSRMETNPGHAGNVFGNSGVNNTVVFESGSAYVFRAGSNPFALTAPNSKVVFQAGSVYRHSSTNQPSVAGRTYADFEFNLAGAVNFGGTNLWTLDHLRVLQGTMTVNTNQAMLVRNDLTVSPGATFNYAPPIGATMTFGGAVVQSISCPNNAEAAVAGLNLGQNATVTTTAGHPGLTVAAGDLSPIGTFSPQTKVTCTGTGRVIMGINGVLSPGATGWIHGPLGRYMNSSPAVFPVGTASLRSDVTLTFAGLTSGGHLIVSTASGDHVALPGSGLDPLKSVNRAWTIQNGTGSIAGPTFTTVSATLTYDPTEIDAGATPANFIVGKRDGGTWTFPSHGPGTATSIEATGLTSFSDFAVAEHECLPITVLPVSLPGGTSGTPYSQILTASGGTAPYTFAVTSGSLPPGLTLASGGALTGTPTTAGTFPFTVTATDAFNCTGSNAYSVTIAPVEEIEPGPAPSCIATVTPCVLVPVVFTRANTTPALAYSVTVQLSSELALCGPGFTSAGYLPAGAGGTAFLVTPAGSNTWTVDESTLGPPCGATGDGTLFYVHVTSSGPPTGTGTISVTATTVRDCANAPLPGPPGTPAAVTIDLAAPAAVSSLTATPHLSGNDADGTRRITLSFGVAPDAASTQVWRRGFGGYPQYDENGGSAPTVPASPTAAAGAGWTLTAVTGSGQTDEPATRDFWHYVAYSTDACGNVSAASGMTAGTLNYHLGDVHNGVATCVGDNSVGTSDVSFLGAHYFSILPVNDPLECLDVGPTTDLSPGARPTTDNVLNFEDLILFGIHYGQVSAPAFAVTPAVVEGDASALWVESPAQVTPGERVRAVVRMRGAGDLQGLSARLGWNAAVVEPRGFESGGWLETDDGVVLGAGPGGVDAALLGVRGHGIHGEGTLAILTFEARAAGNPGFRIAQAQGRDAANRRRPLAGVPGDVAASAPLRTAIDLAFPNPFTQRTSVQLSLVRAGHVKLVAFDLGGRQVRTLVDGNLEAGRHSVTWDGRSDAGAQLAPGAYVVRLETGEVVQSRQISIVR